MLKQILNDMIDSIGDTFVPGIPGPSVSGPIRMSNSPGWKLLNETIRNNIDLALSNYHYVENNAVGAEKPLTVKEEEQPGG